MKIETIICQGITEHLISAKNINRAFQITNENFQITFSIETLEVSLQTEHDFCSKRQFNMLLLTQNFVLSFQSNQFPNSVAIYLSIFLNSFIFVR